MRAFGFGGQRAARRRVSGLAPVPAAQSVILAILAGQSNIQGRNSQDGLDGDLTDVFQFVGHAAQPDHRTLSSDITPIDWTEGLDRIGPAGALLAQLKADNPASIVVAVPVSAGSTAMVGGPTPNWAPGATPGSGGTLFELMVEQANLARAAVLSAWPGATIAVRIHFAQGEQDASAGVSKAAYLAGLTDFVTFARSRITGATNAPVLLASMVPEKWTVGDPNHVAGFAAINAAQVDASLSIAGVRYVVGPLDPSNANDNLHYQPASAARELGSRMAAAWTDAAGPTVTSAASYSNTAGSKLAFALTGSDQHQTLHLNGGADAALFEISDPYLSPVLRWAGDGTGPAAGSYLVGVRARDGAGNYGATKAVTLTVAAPGAVSPTSFFSASERGMVWDLSDAASLFQDVAGTTPVTAAGQPVGRVLDKSGNGNHWVAAADNNTRPTWQVDGDGKPFLQFDGSNDVLFAATPYVQPATSIAVTAIMGIFAAAQSATKTLLSANSTTAANPFVVAFQASGTTTSIVLAARNDAGSALSPAPTLTGQLDSTKRVLTSVQNGGGQRAALRHAGSRPAGGGTGGYTATTAGSTAALPVTPTRAGLGANCAATPANFYNGRIYSGFAINRVLSDAEIAAGEDWVAARTGVTLP